MKKLAVVLCIVAVMLTGCTARSTGNGYSSSSNQSVSSFSPSWPDQSKYGDEVDLTASSIMSICGMVISADKTDKLYKYNETTQTTEFTVNCSGYSYGEEIEDGYFCYKSSYGESKKVQLPE